ncbi:MAG: hypothetical protein KTR22_01440 [Flavobacteriaceae bacterium]|nr:hypothetical protein [Flavobacteriaceae bacterium]
MNHHFVEHTNPKLSHYVFESEKASFKVFPNLGGSLLHWESNGVPILAPFPISEAGIDYYETFYASSLLFPFPNRLNEGKFSHEGKHYELPINDGANGCAIHGCISKAIFEVESLTSQEICLKYVHDANGEFPFDFQLKISYRFSNDGLELGFEIQNLDKESFPFGLGWHPYFALEDDSKSAVSFQSNITYLTNDNMIPLQGETIRRNKIRLKDAQLDTAFALQEPRIELTTNNYRLMATTPGFDFVQLFIPEDRKSIAIEPMTCIANSFNNGIGKRILQPGDTQNFSLQLNLDL